MKMAATSNPPSLADVRSARAFSQSERRSQVMARLKWGIAGSVPELRAMSDSLSVGFRFSLSRFAVMGHSTCWRRDSVAGLWDVAFLIIHPQGLTKHACPEVVGGIAEVGR